MNGLSREDVLAAKIGTLIFIITGTFTGLFMSGTLVVPLWVGLPIGAIAFYAISFLFIFSIISAGEAN